jgi:hypothetical protein
MFDEGTANKSIKDALFHLRFNINAEVPGLIDELHAAVGVLLANAQKARQVRQDVNVLDVMGLVVGIFSAVEMQTNISSRRRILHVMSDGLRWNEQTPR